MRLIVRCIFLLYLNFVGIKNRFASRMDFLCEGLNEVLFGNEYKCKNTVFSNKNLPLNYFLLNLFQSFDINKYIYYLLLILIPAMIKTILIVSLVILACWAHPHEQVGVCPDYKGLIQHGICMK